MVERSQDERVYEDVSEEDIRDAVDMLSDPKQRKDISTTDVLEFLDHVNDGSLRYRIEHHLSGRYDKGKYDDRIDTDKGYLYILKNIEPLTLEQLGTIIKEKYPGEMITMEQVKKLAPDYTDEELINYLVGQESYHKISTDGGFVFSQEERNHSQQKRKLVFVIGDRRSKYADIKKVLNGNGIQEFVHLPDEDLDSPSDVTESIRNSEQVFYFTTQHSHKIVERIESFGVEPVKLPNANSLKLYFDR